MGRDSMTCGCICLNGEQYMVRSENGGLAKYAMRIKIGERKPRRLTRDEALAWAAAPGTSAERNAACERVHLSPEGVQIVLRPRKWKPGEIESAIAQMERPSANTDELH